MTTTELKNIEWILERMLQTLVNNPDYLRDYPKHTAMIRDALISVRREKSRGCWSNMPEGWEAAIVRREQ